MPSLFCQKKQNMENRNTILQELEEISPYIAQSEKKNPYQVSSLYFDNLAATVIENIKQDKEPSYFFTQEIPFSVPTHYFEELPQLILQKAAGQNKYAQEVFEEMESISPLLNTINKKSVYTVPEDYLAKAVWNRNEQVATKAKVISFTRSKRMVRFAAAAIITALLAIGIFLFTNKQNTDLQASNNEVTSEMKKLSEDEIIDFLKTNSSAENLTSVITNTNPNDGDIKKSVSEIPDNEIQQFLQESGEQDEI